jgi:hypothetical protein
MAAHIGIDDANAWLEPTKLTLSDIDPNLEGQVSAQIFGRLLASFDTSTWLTSATTPQIVRTVIAMYYVAWTYDKFYSDDAESNAYASLLRQNADLIIAGLLAGTIELVELPTANDEIGSPVFFPNDVSSAACPTADNPSAGGPSFTMGTVF